VLARRRPLTRWRAAGVMLDRASAPKRIPRKTPLEALTKRSGWRKDPRHVGDDVEVPRCPRGERGGGPGVRPGPLWSALQAKARQDSAPDCARPVIARRHGEATFLRPL
jgi:hypothetical protein